MLWPVAILLIEAYLEGRMADMALIAGDVVVPRGVAAPKLLVFELVAVPHGVTVPFCCVFAHVVTPYDVTAPI